MKELKVWFTDFWPEWNYENFIIPILKKHFIVILEQNMPDVLFHSIFNRMTYTPTYKCKKFLYLGENYRASQYNSDYTISFDPHTKTNFRLPLWQVYLINNPELKDLLFNRINHENFDRFCSFVVSNPANFFRNGFYNQMSLQSFGKVHSYGRYMNNNLELHLLSEGKYWRDAKFEFFKLHKHKYSICFEHSSYPYYCTEKLMDAFLAGSLPLYWGDPKINEDWNSEAFINVGKMGTENAINLIRRLESDNNMFEKIYSQPVFTDEQKERHINNINKFEEWLVEKINL